MKYKLKKNIKSSLPHASQSGFTLIELVVVIAIMGIMSGIILANYSGFNSSASLDNLAQDIALTIRKAQMSAISVKGVDLQGTTIFPGFGVHFQIPSGLNQISGGEKSFIFFADIPPAVNATGDKQYNYDQLSLICDSFNFSQGRECMDIIGIKSLDTISEICINDSQDCYSSERSPALDVVFTRPNLDAQFYFCASTTSCRSDISSATIKIKSSKNKIKEITIRNTGQISVNDIPPEVTIAPIVLVKDITPPVITLNGGSSINLNVGFVFADPGVTAFDNIDGYISSRVVSTGIIDTNSIGTYIITYNVKDNAGNDASPVTRVIIVK